jgi:hypothetical protein
MLTRFSPEALDEEIRITRNLPRRRPEQGPRREAA